MAHFTSDYTANGVPAIHAGLNTQIVRKTFAFTGSGSQTLLVTPLPAGSKVVNVRHCISRSDWGTGGEQVSLFACIGGITAPGSAAYRYIESAALVSHVATGSTVVEATQGKDIGKRITASANLFANYTNLVGTGTGSLDITVVVQYMTDARGD